MGLTLYFLRLHQLAAVKAVHTQVVTVLLAAQVEAELEVQQPQGPAVLAIHHQPPRRKVTPVVMDMFPADNPQAVVAAGLGQQVKRLQC
jgi:hypothetical protein